MGVFVVVREPGPRWDTSRPLRQQEGWNEHAAFMDALAEDGFIVIGGPLGRKNQALHVVDADGPEEIESRLDQDPWTRAEMLRLASIEPWEILLRSGRLPE